MDGVEAIIMAGAIVTGAIIAIGESDIFPVSKVRADAEVYNA